jgi:GR25 family glycosyltransferase involved in LPS biosynthesis
MEHIDAILYINLAHRTDRKEHVIHEIRKICVDDSKIHRIDAIRTEPGALGCGLSHIKALEYAMMHPEWKTILILEDDFTFHGDDSAALLRALHALLTFSPTLDMGLLSYNASVLRYGNTSHPLIKRILYSQTTSSYCIRSTYLSTLHQNMQESTMDMIIRGKTHENCVDIHWTTLQPWGQWYALFPAIGYQYDNYSDIEKRVTEYGC